jgi:hypothetical protein
LDAAAPENNKTSADVDRTFRNIGFFIGYLNTGVVDFSVESNTSDAMKKTDVARPLLGSLIIPIFLLQNFMHLV